MLHADVNVQGDRGGGGGGRGESSWSDNLACRIVNISPEWNVKYLMS